MFIMTGVYLEESPICLLGYVYFVDIARFGNFVVQWSYKINWIEEVVFKRLCQLNAISNGLRI